MRVISSRARMLLRTAIVWDNHGCMPLRADATFLPWLERYRTSGVSLASLNIGFAEIPWTEHIRVLSFMRQWIVRQPHAYCLVSSVEVIAACKSDGRLGIVF